jgi:hypothetical protein
MFYLNIINFNENNIFTSTIFFSIWKQENMLKLKITYIYNDIALYVQTIVKKTNNNSEMLFFKNRIFKDLPYHQTFCLNHRHPEIVSSYFEDHSYRPFDSIFLDRSLEIFAAAFGSFELRLYFSAYRLL